MALPRLMHPIIIAIEPLNRVATIVDDDFREPIQQGNRAIRYSIPGQVKWGGDDQAKASNLGSESESDGYVLFRFVDLRNAGINVVKQGDRFVSMGSGANKQDIDVYVVKIQQMGHYPDRSGPSLVRAWFKDRHPAKQNRGGI